MTLYSECKKKRGKSGEKKWRKGREKKSRKKAEIKVVKIRMETRPTAARMVNI